MYYVLVNKQGHYLARLQRSVNTLTTTRHLQEAMWLLHKDYRPAGFEVKTLKITLK